MPINIQNEAASALKVGHESVSSGYVGHEQVYPNSVTIQSFVFTDTSNLAYDAGATRIARVTGDLGSTYSLAGTNGVNTSINGNYTLNTSPTDHNAVIAAQSGCTTPARTPTVTLTPSGNTVLQGGGSTFTASITQTAGPGITYNYSGSLNISATIANSVTTTLNNTLYFTTGATCTVTWSWSGFTNVPSGFVPSIRITRANGSGTFSNGNSTLYYTGASGSGSDTYTNSSTYLSYFSFIIQLTNDPYGCVDFTNDYTTSNSVTP